MRIGSVMLMMALIAVATWAQQDASAQATKAAPTPIKVEANGPALKLDLGGGIILEAVPIPAGKFIMGRDANAKEKKFSETPPKGEYNPASNAWPAHEVTIAKPFYIGKYEVTQEQFEKIMGYNPSKTIGPKNPVDGGGVVGKDPNRLSWPRVELFCKKVSELTGKTVRLPTEGEWEYAAKAGENPTVANKSKEALAKVLDEIAWWEGNSEGHTHAVGTKKPNAWGVYDTIGNVYEMTQSWQMAYPPNPVVDPQGAAVVLTDKQKEQAQGHKMVRGEYYAHGPSGPHKWTYRFGKNAETFSRGDVGFRIVVEAPMAP